MIVLFWFSLFLIALVTAGYPLMVWGMGRLWPKPVRKKVFEPKVSLLISAFNEEKDIAQTIQNKLSLDYPKNLLEILVVSDGSTDATEKIIASFEIEGGVKLLVQWPRQGKTAALNLAAQNATGDILVFSDANSLYRPDALKKLLQNFHDPSVGYVTGQMLYQDKQGSLVGSGCSAYMRYENLLRSLETRAGSVVGVDGGIDAMRRSLYEPLEPEMLPDLILPLLVIQKGHRVVYEPEALVFEQTLSEMADEWKMRIRVSLRSFHALWRMRVLFQPWVSGFYAFQLFTHKLLRYWMGFLQIFLLASNFFLWPQGTLYQVFFTAQIGLYAIALLGYVLALFHKNPWLFRHAYYFCLLNAAAVVAFGKFLKGEQQIVWTPRKGV